VIIYGKGEEKAREKKNLSSRIAVAAVFIEHSILCVLEFIPKKLPGRKVFRK
jgi:hypothetical protein